MQVQINLQLLPTLMFVCKTWVIVSVGFTIHDERKYKLIKKNIFERTKDSDNWIISNSSYEELRSLDEIRAKVNYERVQDVLYCLDVLKRHVSPSNLKTIYKNLSNLLNLYAESICGNSNFMFSAIYFVHDLFSHGFLDLEVRLFASSLARLSS